jgi:hypothetical protein
LDRRRSAYGPLRAGCGPFRRPSPGRGSLCCPRQAGKNPRSPLAIRTAPPFRSSAATEKSSASAESSSAPACNRCSDSRIGPSPRAEGTTPRDRTNRSCATLHNRIPLSRTGRQSLEETWSSAFASTKSAIRFASFKSRTGIGSGRLSSLATAMMSEPSRHIRSWPSLGR